MITPKFSITQDYEYIHIVIHAPHVKTQQVDILAEQDEFRFVVAPYFLRLKLPGNIIEDDRSSAKYDLSTGEFKIVLPKETPGQFFEDLDLLSKLLARKSDSTPNASKGPGKSLIEVLSSTSTELPPSELLEDEELDWEIPQELPTETLSFGKVGYGFNGAYSGYFDHIQEMPNEINEIPNPETTPVLERRKIRLALEDEKFDEDYYLGDLSAENEEEFQSIFKFKPKWAKILKEVQKQKKCPTNTLQVSDNAPRKIIEEVTPQVSLDVIEQKPAASKILIQEMSNDSSLIDSKTSTNTIEEKMSSLSMDYHVSRGFDSQSSVHALLEFTEKEKAAMVSLSRKEYILNKEESRPIYLGLVDLILSYSYEYRVTLGEFSVESSWTIGKLCSSMACLESFYKVCS
ncbi:hypothetical protein DSO57_1011790 [Entomophthora muscae]|uniref:Uncharacterized protein n=1 Tax=Entomophthora muscae TaxID=34485 RepID=A0ACC2TGT9_9FUNG|nr:hypothetical protein DSO57_1011790 [Entomophthora muscae]